MHDVSHDPACVRVYTRTYIHTYAYLHVGTLYMYSVGEQFRRG